jgi:hypothetical protein
VEETKMSIVPIRVQPRARCRRAILTAILLGALAMALAPPAAACTTAVVSAKASATGRPMLWKNRDADGSDNQVVFLSDGRYPFVALVNRGDVMGLQVWAGINAAGFGIMNSASYNLEKGDTVGEGTLMRLALQSCATVDDFEKLLERSNAGGRDVSANFGVIDARGGAAVFETGSQGFRRFDAADPACGAAGAQGVLVRSNYSHSGSSSAGSGLLREARAVEMLSAMTASGGTDPRRILAGPARDAANPAIGSTPDGPGARLLYTADSVCRLDTVSAVVLEAPAADEPAAASAMWIVPSLPLSGPAFVVFPAAGSVPAEIAAAGEPSPVVRQFLARRTRLYPETRGEMKRYMRRDALLDLGSTALPRFLAADEENFLAVERARAAWRKVLPAPAAVEEVQRAVARRAVDASR